MSYTHPNSIP
ncbi:unnamed protein product, partial [Adineta steineri]